jgi:UDP-N-acetylglucosamine--N-acetylmuramyl-(pentapeptide) pyrophosphoryl-undecaprenol N-acetylglucosamine transferase
MKVIISAGGTGGHIYPALAIMKKIKELEPDSSFLYIGTTNRMEKDIVPALNIPYKGIEINGLTSKNPIKIFKTFQKFRSASKICADIIKKFHPDIVIGCGGYVTAPVLAEASKQGFKTFIHEQNSVPGKTNKFLAKKGAIVGVSFKSTLKYFKDGKAIYTGNPASEEAIKTLPILKEKYGLAKDKKLVYIVMGSLGSEKLNAYFTKMLYQFKDKPYEVLYISGKNYYNQIKNNNFPPNVKIEPFINSQVGILKNADLIVSRAGATTISEIIALKLPSILVPSPYVANNHQYKNALDLSERGATVLLEEKDLVDNNLINKIDEILFDEQKINNLKKNMEELYVPASATKVADFIRQMVKND